MIFGWSPGARFKSCLFAKLLVSSSSDYRKNRVPGSCLKFCSQFTVITRSSPYLFAAMPALVTRQESSLHSSNPSSASSPSYSPEHYSFHFTGNTVGVSISTERNGEHYAYSSIPKKKFHNDFNENKADLSWL